MKIVSPNASLLWVTPNALQVIEAAGRVCYKSENNISDNSASDFIGKIIKRGHESVIEHASAAFKIITDRGITHEIVRHRIASFSQESTRYCNYSKDKFDNEISVIEPPEMNDATRKSWVTACQTAETEYFKMLAAGATPQIARSVLPTCLKSEIIMTCNFREWRHFLKLRLANGAHPQIIQIAEIIKNELCSKYPEIFSNL